MNKSIDHCGLISRMKDKENPPRQYDGKCEGYCNADRDEPCEECKWCKFNMAYEE